MHKQLRDCPNGQSLTFSAYAPRLHYIAVLVQEQLEVVVGLNIGKQLRKLPLVVVATLLPHIVYGLERSQKPRGDREGV